jgi:hypothetical protein
MTPVGELQAEGRQDAIAVVNASRSQLFGLASHVSLFRGIDGVGQNFEPVVAISPRISLTLTDE